MVADADLGDQLNADAGVVVGVFEIMDQFREILDGIDVRVRRGRDSSRRGVEMTDAGRSTDKLFGRPGTFAGLAP